MKKTKLTKEQSALFKELGVEPREHNENPPAIKGWLLGTPGPGRGFVCNQEGDKRVCRDQLTGEIDSISDID